MKVIIFDVGDVIVKSDYAITYRILEGYGVPKDRAQKFFENDDYLEFSRGKIDGKGFYQVLIDAHLRFQLSYAQVIHSHNEHLYGIDNGVVAILKKLPRNQLSFLTDTNEWQTQRERELINLKKYSDLIFRSHEIHMLKIDDGLFPYVLDQLKYEPHEILLVDDSPEKIQKAEKYGLHTLRFKNSEQLAVDLGKKSFLNFYHK